MRALKSGILLLSLLTFGCETEQPAPAVPVVVDAGVKATTTTVAEAAPSETTEDLEAQASLRAKLLGLGKKPPEEATEEEVEAPPPPPPRRRAPVDDEPLEPEEPTIGLSDGAFQNVVNNWRGIQRCLAEKAPRAVDRTGAVRIAFRVRPNGTVAEAKVIETTTPVARRLAPCIEAKAQRLTFPEFGGEDFQKEAKFVF